MQKVLFAILISTIAVSLAAEAKRAKRNPASIEGPFSVCSGVMDEQATIDILSTQFDFSKGRLNDKDNPNPYHVYGEVTMDTIELDAVKLNISSIHTEPIACPVPKKGSGYIDQTCSVTEVTGTVSLLDGTAPRPLVKMTCKNHIARTY